MRTVAIVDIGSNSIKLLVASRDANGRVQCLLQQALDVRISAGINARNPRLEEAAMTAGVAAITSLLDRAKAHAPGQTVLVATSAVRDATNGPEFCERVHRKCGFGIRILSGTEEANGIGRGLLCDPELRELQDFTLFDLGGGSLECLSFRQRRIVHAASLPLGCVRLTEKFVSDRQLRLEPGLLHAISQYASDMLRAEGFGPANAMIKAIATGGSIVNVRNMAAARASLALEATSTHISRTLLSELLNTIADMSLPQRQQIPGLTPARADVFPTALATLLGIADCCKLTGFHHSFYNLRYGIADAALD
ncbi:MAG: phosphatase [Cephaloticoccus sp.]|nr:phosphatase [Cephaloticoccus sp.]